MCLRVYLCIIFLIVLFTHGKRWCRSGNFSGNVNVCVCDSENMKKGNASLSRPARTHAHAHSTFFPGFPSINLNQTDSIKVEIKLRLLPRWHHIDIGKAHGRPCYFDTVQQRPAPFILGKFRMTNDECEQENMPLIEINYSSRNGNRVQKRREYQTNELTK